MNKFKYDRIVDLGEQNSITKIIKLVGTQKRVLEVGCATGYMSKILKEQLACEVIGVELDPDAAHEAEEFCKRVIIGDIESLDLGSEFKPEMFDVIIFSDVLEHFKNPWKILSNISVFLKDDGFLLSSIPNIAHASVILELIEGNFQYRPLGLLDDTHLRFFTKRSIYELFEKTGYVVSIFDRVKIPPQLTEIKSRIDKIPQEIINRIYNRNDEADTYQFIVKAYRSSERGNILKLKEHINELEIQIKQEEDEIKQKEDEIQKKEDEIQQKDIMIQRYQNSMSWRITAPLRRLYDILKLALFIRKS